MLSKPIIAAIAFVVSAAIALAILHFMIQLHNSVLKLAIGIVVGLIVAGVAFVVVKEPAKQ